MVNNQMENNNFFSLLGKFIKRIIYLLVVVILISFVSSNHSDVELSLFPFPQTITAPIFLIFLIALAVGFIVGIIYNRFNTDKKKTNDKPQP